MAEYKGGGGDAIRIRELSKQREKTLQDIQAQKDKISRESHVGDINSKFAGKSSTVEDHFRQQTVGLKTREEFRKTREELEQEERIKQVEIVVTPATEAPAKPIKKTVTSKLSFANPDEGDDEEVNTPTLKKAKAMKNPFVDTSFLPDKEREERENDLRRRLAEEWLQTQERVKAEMIEITYSYWDGTGHRASVQVSKGSTIADFLSKVQKEWKELRGVSVENLMYIKEDLIIPHHFSFYDLIVTKARGKSGPLFHFDVHDDVRIVNDARVEKDESHAGKVCERRWFESNKHIFPASRWEVYDPTKTYEKYTIHGGEVR